MAAVKAVVEKAACVAVAHAPEIEDFAARHDSRDATAAVRPLPHILLELALVVQQRREVADEDDSGEEWRDERRRPRATTGFRPVACRARRCELGAGMLNTGIARTATSTT